jgi:hypothetical protein
LVAVAETALQVACQETQSLDLTTLTGPDKDRFARKVFLSVTRMNLNPRTLNREMHKKLTSDLKLELVNGIIREGVSDLSKECTPAAVEARAREGGYLDKRSKKLGMCLGIQGANVMDSGLPQLVLPGDVLTKQANRLSGVTIQRLGRFLENIWPMARELMKSLADNKEFFTDEDPQVKAFLQLRAQRLEAAICKIINDEKDKVCHVLHSCRVGGGC